MLDAPLIFLSHAAVDREIAEALKRHLEAALPGIEVFVSSDPEDLQPGDPWVEKILEALARAKLVLALTTDRGLGRKWVWFESGRTWFSGVRCIPCCVGNVRKSSLPPPFSSLQALNIDEVDDLKSLGSKIAHVLGISEALGDWVKITRELTRLDVRAEERGRIENDPFNSEISQEIEKVMSSLDAGSQEVLRLLVKYGEMTEQVARRKVQESNKFTSNTLLLIGLENRTGWLVKTQSSPHPHVSRDEDRYKLTPNIQPYLAAWFARHQ
jgi:hypothetical protein